MTQSDLSGLLEILQQIQDSAIENNAMLKQLLEKQQIEKLIPRSSITIQEFLEDPQKVIGELIPDIGQILEMAERIKKVLPIKK